MKPTYPYTVNSGDWLAKIAQEHGTTVGEIWNHPDNYGHVQKRGAPNVLYPGDIVHIPFEPDAAPPPTFTPPPGPPSLPTVHPEKCTLHIPGLPDAVQIVAVKLEEAISRPSRARITVLMPMAMHSAAQEALLGARAVAVLPSFAGCAVLDGIVYSLQLIDENFDQPLAKCHVFLASPLDLLRRRHRSRIFQGRALDELVEIALAEIGVTVSRELTGVYDKRQYCTQHDESDWSLVERLLSEGAMFLYSTCLEVFSTPTEMLSLAQRVLEGETRPHACVLADSVASYRALEGVLARVDPGSHAVGVESLGWLQTLGQSQRQHRAYDSSHPDFDLGSVLIAEDAQAAHLVNAALAGEAVYALEDYEHGISHLYPSTGFLTALNQRRFDVSTGASSTVELRTTEARASPATLLNLRDLLPAMGSVVVETVKHYWEIGAAGGVAYYNEVEARDASHLPSIRRPRRRSVSSCYARVAGDVDARPAVDSEGRVKVHLPWARPSDNPNTTSCWLRVATPWSGAAFGTQFLPRAGTQVLVIFVDGHQDHPVIAGSFYDGTHPSPLNLPAEATQTGIRTQSLDGLGGYNELWFDDAAGAERVALRAERDLVLDVQNDHALNVKGQSSIEVDGTRTLKISGNARTVIRGDARLDVGASRIETVEGHCVLAVHGATARHHHGDLDVHVRQDRRVSIEGLESKTVVGSSVSNVISGMATFVGTDDNPTQYVTGVVGDYILEASQDVVIQAGEALRAIAGDAEIQVGPSGVRIRAGDTALVVDQNGISLVGGAIQAGAGSISLSAAGDIAVASAQGSSLGLNAEVHLDGAQILLNSAAEAEAPRPSAQELEVTVIRLVDVDGSALARHPFKIVSNDGGEVTVRTDERGEFRTVMREDAHLVVLHGKELS